MALAFYLLNIAGAAISVGIVTSTGNPYSAGAAVYFLGNAALMFREIDP